MAPAPEVIQDWADYVPLPGPAGAAAGPYTFERGRMSEAINAVCVDMPDEARKKQAKLAGEKAAQGKKLKKEDVEYLVRELMLPRHKAETALQEADGDLVAAVKKAVVA